MATDRPTGAATGSDAGRGDPERESHLARSRAVWDRWSGHYGLSERDFEPMRETALDHLDLECGDRVLEIGPGPGVNFDRIRHEIGPAGELLAVDYSTKMLAKARRRVDDRDWDNVDVISADATRADVGEGFDAAVATLSLSVMPDVRDAIENVHRSLAPDGRFVVFDLRTVPSGSLRVVNPFLWRALYAVAN